MRRKPVSIQDILTHDQVWMIQKRLKQALGPAILQEVGRYGMDMEWSIRFMAVSSRTKARREALGLSIKEAARTLKVPQYQLGAIEEGRRREILPEVLDAYLKFLRLKPWFGKWQKANPQVTFSQRRGRIP